MRLSAFLATFFIAVFIAGAADAGRVKGKIVLSSDYLEWLTDQEREAESARRASYWREPNGVLPTRPPAVQFDSDIAVVLRSDDGKPGQPNKVKTVKVRAGKLEPTVVVTHPGSTLRFKSVDPFEHELYSPGLDDFQPDRQTQGAFRPIDFAQEGTFEVRCRLMPSFVGYVVVTLAQVVAQVSADGSFSAENLEKGQYTIKVFHRGKWIATERVEVSENHRGTAFVEIAVKPPSGEQGGSPGKGEDKSQE